jgi:hypothetical protein
MDDMKICETDPSGTKSNINIKGDIKNIMFCLDVEHVKGFI